MDSHTTVDAEMIRDSCRFKMDLAAGLERTVHGKVKPSTNLEKRCPVHTPLTVPVITQCEIRKLYGNQSEPGAKEAIEVAKTYERRRCGHHPNEYPEPLGTEECLQSVVDPKETHQNKHRYVVASQAQEVRRMLRGIRGVPLIYIKRSVMILEPMADDSVQVRVREERGKFRAELKNALGKRKREEKDGDDDSEAGEKPSLRSDAQAEDKKKKKKKAPGRKGPNPLSVKKAKKKPEDGEKKKHVEETPAEEAEPEANQDGPSKPKRKRRRKAKAADGGDAAGAGDEGMGEAKGLSGDET